LRDCLWAVELGKFLSKAATLSKKVVSLGYIIDYSAGEIVGCSSQITLADRIFYVKLFDASASQFFSGDQQGVIQKEISKAEFDVWVNILADGDFEVAEIQKVLSKGKKY